MSRVWATARVLAALAGTIFGAYWIFYALGRWARWSGYSPDEQTRLKADVRRRRGLGEPDHFDVLDEEKRKRNTLVAVRLLPDETKLLNAAAQASGLPLSRYIREAAMDTAKGVLGLEPGEGSEL